MFSTHLSIKWYVPEWEWAGHWNLRNLLPLRLQPRLTAKDLSSAKARTWPRSASGQDQSLTKMLFSSSSSPRSSSSSWSSSPSPSARSRKVVILLPVVMTQLAAWITTFFGMPGLPSKRRFACHSSQRTTEPQFCLVQFVHVPSGGITFEDASCPFKNPFLPPSADSIAPHLQYLLLKNQGKTTGIKPLTPIFWATTSLFEGQSRCWPGDISSGCRRKRCLNTEAWWMRPKHEDPGSKRQKGVPEKPEKRSKNVKARTGKRLQKKNHSEQSWSLKCGIANKFLG